MFLGFQDLLAYIRDKLSGFRLWNISYAQLQGNRCAHEIALSVTRDQQYQSYIARGGPFWLRSLIKEDAKEDTWSLLEGKTLSLTGLVSFLTLPSVCGFTILLLLLVSGSYWSPWFIFLCSVAVFKLVWTELYLVPSLIWMKVTKSLKKTLIKPVPNWTLN